MQYAVFFVFLEMKREGDSFFCIVVNDAIFCWGSDYILSYVWNFLLLNSTEYNLEF